MPPPMWHLRIVIVTYYLSDRHGEISGLQDLRFIAMRPVPQRGTGGARGRLRVKKHGSWKSIFFGIPL